MRVLFISGTTVGGSGRSQRELAARLIRRGHEVSFVVDDEAPSRIRRFIYERCADGAVRWGERPGARIIRLLERQPGKRTRRATLGGIAHRITPVPENAARAAIEMFRPDVVVGNSILRLTWRKVRQLCDERAIATVFYVREVASMNHFTLGVTPAHRIVANATSLAQQVREHGYPCSVLPSVIEIDVTTATTSRRVALVINPIPSHGIDLIWQLAERLPDVPFIIQQSWPLGREVVESIEQIAARYPNVAFRPPAPAGASLYSDARLLLVPHRIDNRPRVIAEAQANGIPVVASHTPGLEEAVGPGGILVDMNDLDEWVSTVRTLWTNDVTYDALVDRAIKHSQRPEIDPERITAAFEELLRDAYEDAIRETATAARR